MRGTDEQQTSFFILGDVESMIPADEPLRALRTLVDEVLAKLDGDFARMYAKDGRPSIAPEQLLRATILMMVESLRSELQVVRSIRFNVLHRWFVGLGVTDVVWDASTFSKNRERLLRHEIAQRFLDEVVALARSRDLISDDHLTADGTHLKASASMKTFLPRDDDDNDTGGQSRGDRNQSVDFHGQRRSNETHRSRTDPDARLMKKSKGDSSKLVHAGHLLTENRHGLVVQAMVTVASGTAEREAALTMLANRRHPRQPTTLGADKGYDASSFVEGCRAQLVTPHVASKVVGSAVDGRTTRHAGYVISQRKRKLVEEVFGWMKTVAGLDQLRLRGTLLVESVFCLAAGVYDLIRMRNILSAA